MANKKQAQGDETRGAILTEARRLFARIGFDGTSMDMIAKAVGVPKSLLYYHFKSKAALLASVFESFHDDASGARNAIMSPQKTAASTLDFVEEHRELFAIIVGELMKDEPHPAVIEVVKAMYEDGVSRLGSAGVNLDAKQSFAPLFFFGIFPVIGYVTLGEHLSQSLGITGDAFRASFEAAYARFAESVITSSITGGSQ